MKFLKTKMGVIALFSLFTTIVYANVSVSPETQAIIVKAKNNDKQALYQLAYLKHFGEDGIEKNVPEAIELYKRASALGHRSANHNLGLIYYKGMEVSVDYVEAAKWLIIASERNLEDSQRILLSMYQKNLIPKDEKKLEQLYIQLAEKGKQEDLATLADYYYFEKSDLISGKRYTLELAKKDVPKYQSRLGMIYIKSIDGKPDYQKAYFWFLKAAEANDFNGKIGLASLYLSGQGVEQNTAKASEWFDSAYLQDPEKACEIIHTISSKINNQHQRCILSKEH